MAGMKKLLNGYTMKDRSNDQSNHEWVLYHGATSCSSDGTMQEEWEINENGKTERTCCCHMGY